jgi:PadR family transcriptional regulator, regulatory protein PadR
MMSATNSARPPRIHLTLAPFWVLAAGTAAVAHYICASCRPATRAAGLGARARRRPRYKSSVSQSQRLKNRAEREIFASTFAWKRSADQRVSIDMTRQSRRGAAHDSFRHPAAVRAGYAYGDVPSSGLVKPGLSRKRALTQVTPIYRGLYIRISHQTRLVLQAFLDQPGTETYGYSLSQATGLKAGTLYPILQRLVAEGWLEARSDEADDRRAIPRRRRYYRLSPEGGRNARAAVDHDSFALRELMPGWGS